MAPTSPGKEEGGLWGMSPATGVKQSGGDGGLQMDENGPPLPEKMSGAAGQAGRPIGGGLGGLAAVTAEECLVVSGALDRTLCVFRARFGQGLSLLRRLNVACSPRGLPGALIVGTPVQEANGSVAGTQLEVSLDSGWLLGACLGGLRTTTTVYLLKFDFDRER